MSLLLPAELELSIIEQLDPVSTLHLALSSKAQYNLCEDRLREHASLFEKYSIIRPSDDDEFLIWSITKEILKDPSKGWYIRELDLISNRQEERQEMPSEDRSLFIAAAERLEHLYACEMEFFATDRYQSRAWVDMMVEDINFGFEDPILVLLVHHLPRLHTFRMTDMSMTDAFQVFMRRVAAGYQNPATAPHMPLQHLRLAAIARNDTENHCSVDWAIYFVCIPSLKTFTAFMMGSEEIGQYDNHREAHLRTTATDPVSNVAEVIFNSCQFDPETFDTLLPLIKNLERFEYDAGGHIVAETQDMEPRKVIRALLAHASHSLEELSLAEVSVNYEGFNEDDIVQIPVKDFKKLKALHCEARWLLYKPNDSEDEINQEDEELSENPQLAKNLVKGLTDEVKDPRDNLPQSLEYLYLDGLYKGDEWDDMVETFKTPNANTPELTLDKVCLNRDGTTKFGSAVEPNIRINSLSLEDIWRGHNYFL